MKNSAKGIIHVALYVNYNLMIESPVATNEVEEQLKKNGPEGLWDYLSYEIWLIEDKKKA